MSKELQQSVYLHFEQLPIAYNAGLANSLGSIEAAIILGQLLYWHGHGRNKVWIYKTIVEMKFETGISRHKQDSAIKLLKQLGMIEVKKMGIPGRRHFKIDIPNLNQWLTSLSSSSRQVDAKSVSTIVNNQQRNSDNYQRIPKNTSDKHYRQLVKDMEKLSEKLSMNRNK